MEKDPKEEQALDSQQSLQLGSLCHSKRRSVTGMGSFCYVQEHLSDVPES
jgi:hypothetical protein